MCETHVARTPPAEGARPHAQTKSDGFGVEDWYAAFAAACDRLSVKPHYRDQDFLAWEFDDTPLCAAENALRAQQRDEADIV